MKIITAILFLIFTQAAVAQLTIDDAGIWYQPDTEGHGLIITTWPETQNLLAGANITWFTHTESGDGQAWLFSDNLTEGEDTVDFFMPMGAFPAVEYERGEAVGYFRIAKTDENTIKLFFVHYLWSVNCLEDVQPSPPADSCYGELEFKRLTPQRG